MKRLVTGAVVGTLMALSWTGSGDLERIEKRAEEFANKATTKIESLKEEAESVNADKDALIKEIEKLQDLVNSLTLEKDNANATSQTLGSELEKANAEIKKANEETKQTADNIDKILDLDKLN